MVRKLDIDAARVGWVEALAETRHGRLRVLGLSLQPSDCYCDNNAKFSTHTHNDFVMHC
jgi:23S rRNA U2552 (ribose-2'-O)-methylase RlmE/FtsJ